MPLKLSREWIDFIESGVSIAVGSRDAEKRPDCTRGLGAFVAGDRVRLHLFAPLATEMRRNFEDNGAVAATFSRIMDHRTVQLKGQVAALRAGTVEERTLSEMYLGAFAEQVALAGLPRSVVRRVSVWPLLVVEMTPAEMFDQTPGPGAGRRAAP